MSTDRGWAGEGGYVEGERALETGRACMSDCPGDQRFSVTAEGYPMPMFPRLCPKHLGERLALDVQYAGSTGRWIVVAL